MDKEIKASDTGAAPCKGAQHWMNVLSHLDPRYGGLSAVVPQLCSHIALSGKYAVEIAAFCGSDELFSDSNHPEFTLSTWPTSRLDWRRKKHLQGQFRDKVRASSALHIHGIWEQSTAVSCRVAKDLKKPYIISAHGMLEKWALENKRLKKRIYSALIERANLQNARCLHALTQAEADDYRRFGLKGPIAVIPNGVYIPDSIDPRLFLNRYPALEGKRVILFLGRIHFKKGLDLLVKSWAKLAKKWPTAHLVLAGPDFQSTRKTIEKLVVDYGLENHVLFTGMLRNEMKWSALAHAECFVLPSYSEGLSVSVLEAMGVGLPVIITEQCNLPIVGQLQAGWIIKSEIAALTSSLEEVLRNSHSDNSAIGDRGRQLIRDRYSWPTVSSQMIDLYQWVGGGDLPTHLDLVTK